MASDRPLVLNELLAFIQTEIHEIEEYVIFDVCLQFFKKEEIVFARNLLYDYLHIDTYVPPFLCDKRGETSLQNIIDCLRDHDSRDLPIYVANNWSKLPAMIIHQRIIRKVLAEMTFLKMEIAKLHNEMRCQRKRRCPCSICSSAPGGDLASSLAPLAGLSGFAAAVKTPHAEAGPSTETRPPTVAVPPNNSMPSVTTPAAEETTSSEDTIQFGESASADAVPPAEASTSGVAVLTVKSELHFVTAQPTLPAVGETKIFITVHSPKSVDENPTATVVTMIGSAEPITLADINLPSIALAFEGDIFARLARPAVDVENEDDDNDYTYAESSSHSHEDDIAADIETRLMEGPRGKKLAARKRKQNRKARAAAKKKAAAAEQQKPRGGRQ